MSRANDCGTSIEASQSWRRVTIPLATSYLVRNLFWKNIRGGIKRKGSVELWKKIFYELDEFLAFYCATHNKWPRIHDEESQKTTFIAPYGYVNSSTNDESYAQIEVFLEENNLRKIFFDCSVDGVDVKQFLVFVLERKDFEIGHSKFTIFKILFPDPSSRTKFPLMNGVLINGCTGWVPSKSLTQAYCRCPAVSFTASKEEALPYVFIFKPHQIKQGVLQWRVAGLQNQPQVDELPLPTNFAVWDGDVNALEIENGEILDYDLLFKQSGGWMHVRVKRFYALEKRSGRKPFNYEVLYLDGSRERQDILFDLEKYSSEVDAAPSSWCIIREI